METSNFGLNDFPRVSKNQKFYARSNTGLRLIPSGLKIRFIHEKRVFLGVFYFNSGPSEGLKIRGCQ